MEFGGSGKEVVSNVGWGLGEYYGPEMNLGQEERGRQKRLWVGELVVEADGKIFSGTEEML